jgi:hypothetical protein
VAERLVQVPVVEIVVDIALERRKLVIVAHEPVRVEFGRGKLDDDDIVVPVQARALMPFGKMRKLVGGGEVEFLGNAVHHSTSSALKPPSLKPAVAAAQKSGSS